MHVTGPSPDVYCLACDVFDVEPHQHVEVQVGQLWRHRSGAIRVVTFLDPYGQAVMSFVDGSAATTHAKMTWGRIAGGAYVCVDPDWTTLG